MANFADINYMRQKIKQEKLEQFRKDKILITLDLYKSRSVPRNKVDKIINGFDSYITDSLFENLAFDFEEEFEHDEEILRRIRFRMSKHNNPFEEFTT